MLSGSSESNRGARGAKCAAPENEVFCETYVEIKKKIAHSDRTSPANSQHITEVVQLCFYHYSAT